MKFTRDRVPPLVEDTLAAANIDRDRVDYFVLHQSNRFIMRHLASKCHFHEDKMPLTLWEYGNTGGPSVPLTITQGKLKRPAEIYVTHLKPGDDDVIMTQVNQLAGQFAPRFLYNQQVFDF